MKRVMVIIILLAFGWPCLAQVPQPLDVIQTRIDEVISILKDPQYTEETASGPQRERMWNIIEEVFDFREMGKRTLGRYWKKFSDQQLEEFAGLFSKLLGNSYLDKIQRGYKDEKVVYLSQKISQEKPRALVKTKIMRENIEIPVHYSMMRRKEAWRVYDVKIEGVSLVKNYRTQFSSILIKKPPADLLDMLKKKIDRQEKERAQKQKSGRIIRQAVLMAHLYKSLNGHFPKLQEERWGL